MNKIITLGNFKKYLIGIPDEFNNYPLIFSIDDEGNQYKSVNCLPHFVKIKELKYNDIQLIDHDDIDFDQYYYNAVLIN